MGIPRDPTPYADFVGTRWSALYRTAFLLTGGDAEAEELLRSTLVRAYLSWDTVAAAGSAGAYVRRMLVNTFISARRRAWLREEPVEVVPNVRITGAGGAAEDRLGLWPRVLALPPRQRAVVVLRYYEDLTLQETADVLGCSVGTAKSQASDALRALREGARSPARSGAMDELIETRLREDLGRCTTYTDSPPPPIDLLQRMGEQRANRTRARWAVLAAAAAAAVVVVALVWLGGEDPAPTSGVPAPSTPPTSPTTEPPTGAPPSMAYVHDGVLHFRGMRVDVEADSIAYAGVTVLLTKFGRRDGNEVSVLRDDETLLSAGTGFQASLSPGGEYAWWFNEDSRGTTVTVWDTAAGRQRGTHLIDGSLSGPTGGGGDLEVIGVDDSGRLFWSEITGPETREYWMWRPAGPVTQILLEDAGPATLTTAGLQVLGTFISSSFEGDTGPPYIAAHVGDDGVFGSCPTDDGCTGFRSPQQALHSPSASYAVFREEGANGTDSPIRVVAREHEGLRYQFLDPVLGSGTGHTGLGVIGWENDTSLLLLDTHDPNSRRVLRCEVPAMTCESALGIGDGRGWVLPDQDIVP